jgi:hypothetical protein
MRCEKCDSLPGDQCGYLDIHCPRIAKLLSSIDYAAIDELYGHGLDDGDVSEVQQETDPFGGHMH